MYRIFCLFDRGAGRAAEEELPRQVQDLMNDPADFPDPVLKEIRIVTKPFDVQWGGMGENLSLIHI